jgi:lysophospholipase L1-like esterase
LQDAIAAQPSFFLFDLGNNDILGYATGGGSNPAIFTSEANFQGQYNSAITALLTANPNAKGVIANIPDVTTIPFFTTVAWNAIALDAATSSTLTTNLANNYNAFLDGMIAAKYISAEEGAKRKLSYKAGANGILLSDETLTDLTPYMNASANTQPLIPYARARQATATDLITLSAGSILGTAVPGTGGTAVYGVSYPVGDQYVLIPTETAEVKARTTAFNNIIKNAADGSNGRLALADVNATFTALVNARAGVYNGVTITPNFAPPTGAFSEDGVHPNSRGYAFMANIFIDAINAKFSANVPKASIADYKGTGLPVSAQ